MLVLSRQCYVAAAAGWDGGIQKLILCQLASHLSSPVQSPVSRVKLDLGMHFCTLGAKPFETFEVWALSALLGSPLPSVHVRREQFILTRKTMGFSTADATFWLAIRELEKE